MRSLILGTAGHIDHGKTALVRALTGVDTDRLKEEKERGITVDLGFAELTTQGDLHFGVVDVPGHEGFIRNMLAGATGMDLVLLVVAADEGIMPQTREHLAIVRLLGVPHLVVALTKSDLVEADWLELVAEEVEEELKRYSYAGAPIVPVSAIKGEGLVDLLHALSKEGSRTEAKAEDDEARLPIDRVFTIRGAGTVVTGTLWTGRLKTGDRVRILPGDQEARIRSLQVHGREVREAHSGARVAVGLTGGGVTHQTIRRGQALVVGEAWSPSWMLTCRVTVLPDTGWELAHGQRVRIHLGTAEALARATLLEGETLGPGREGWVQFRLEDPILARGGDRLVIRSYSPLTTIAGGTVAEVFPRKRRHLQPGERARLEALVGADGVERLRAIVEKAGLKGIEGSRLPQLLGSSPVKIGIWAKGLLETGDAVELESLLFASSAWDRATRRVFSTLESFHKSEPLRQGMPLEELRQSLPKDSHPRLAEGILRHLSATDALVVSGGLGRLKGFSPTLSPAQEEARHRLIGVLLESGLAVPGLDELSAEAEATQAETESLLRLMESEGDLVVLEGGLFFARATLNRAGASVVEALGGRTGLGPAEFREVLGVSRKYLLPVLRYFDTEGITTRLGEDRSVTGTLPDGWGTYNP
jgi:selenocysteine-specific elongation factor